MKPALIAALVGLAAPAALLAQTATAPADTATGAMPADSSQPTTGTMPDSSAGDAAPAGASTDSAAGTTEAPTAVTGADAAPGTGLVDGGPTEAPTAVTGADAAAASGAQPAGDGATPANPVTSQPAASSDAAAAQPGASADADAPAAEVQELVNQIASGGMFEIRSSEIALERSTDPEVQDFAQTMIRDHGSIMEELEVLAAARNLTVPTELSGPPAEHLRAVEDADAAEIDEVYLDHQAQAHAETLELLEPWTIEPEDAGLGAFAQKTLQAVTTHAERLDTLRD
ncbi:DUF4142 domain-containing protein [Paracoccus sp. Z118]|uniref:DUF4142 domain-containing protein n=1 Tax=Paracoccus sp. Z118 TaxID=2851017 RepID=UPI001C2C19F7|nr:DUF4142 domain-containing protein [Paracoccus sp. Z118]MBV0891306.1 DUF4142 domain-containing protein [Paracoccus sp. Z118]